MREVYKVVDEMSFYGDNEWIETDHEFNPDIGDFDVFFKYEDRKYYLSEFMRCERVPECMEEFHGYASDSFFSGVVIKVSDDGDAIKAFTYIN